MFYTKSWFALAINLVLAFVLSACNSNGGSSSVTHSGSVGDGPITGATIIVADKNGVILATETSDNTANYEITLEIPEDAYPLQIVATGGTDVVTQAVPDFSLLSVATSPSQTKANVNPFSTLITRIALAMQGGINDSNLQIAQNTVIENFGFGFDPRVIPDPIRTPITESNIAAMIKASEALGETIRRSRDALLILGEPVSGDQIMNALAADMTDGIMDGIGTSETDVRIAALVNVVSGQVLVEAMSNSLKVGNVDATRVMDDAIRISLPEAVSVPATDTVQISQRMIDQAERAVEAARAIAPSAELSTIVAVLDSLTPDTLPSNIEPMLPGDTSTDLESAISASVFASEAQLDQINDAVRNMGSGNQGSQNTDTENSNSSGDSTDSSGSNDSGTSDGNNDGNTQPDQQPFANPDSATTNSNQNAIIAVLDNDWNTADKPVTVTITGAPSNGSVSVNGDNTVTYTPDTDYAGQDSFSYRITDNDGDVSVTTVTVDVVCTNGCTATTQSITLSWNPTPGSVDGYLVYFGDSAGTTTQIVSNVASPTVTLDISSDLQASGGDTVCFRIGAYNSAGNSPLSEAVCGII